MNQNTNYDWDKFCKLKEQRVKKEKAKAFAESLDLTPLYKKINEFVGAELTYTSEIEESSNSYRVTFESNDVRKYCGIFGKILSECVVTDFGSGVSVDEESGNFYYWVTVDISYKHKDGGMNGMKLFDAQYTKEDGWKYRMLG